MNAHSGFIDSGDSLLLVADARRNLTAVMPDAALMPKAGVKMLKAAVILDGPVLLTEKYRKGRGATLPEDDRHPDFKSFSALPR